MTPAQRSALTVLAYRGLARIAVPTSCMTGQIHPGPAAWLELVGAATHVWDAADTPVLRLTDRGRAMAHTHNITVGYPTTHQQQLAI